MSANSTCLGAPDTDVMAAARRDQRCVVSVDTDFGELLPSATKQNPASCSSGALRTGHRTRPRFLITALPLLKDHLDIGAIVVLTPDRARVRHLPL